MILVTGGTGLVGSHLLMKLCEQHQKVRAVFRDVHSIDKTKKLFEDYQCKNLFNKIEWFLADITDVPQMIEAYKGIKHVYHCAAFISFNPKDYREMRKINIHGTAIMVNLAIDAKVEKFCFVSSIAAIGDAIDSDLIDETCEWNKQQDNSGYSITKFGAEMEVWRLSQEGVDVVVVNPGVILGTGFWDSGSGKLFSQVDKGFNFYTKGVTGFVSVTDVVNCMVDLMKSNIKNERFILISENKTYQEVFNLIADVLDKKRPQLEIKSWQLAIFWRIATLISKFTNKEPLISKYSAKSALTISKYDNSKIKDVLNYQFEPIATTIEKIGKMYLYQ